MKNFILLLLVALPLLQGCLTENQGSQERESSGKESPDAGSDTHKNMETGLRDISWDAQFNNPYYRKNKSKEGSYYIYVEVNGKDMVGESEKTKRPPLNLSLVLDKSGSMKASKIQYAKEAMDYVVDQLDESDQLSIIEYSTYSSVLQASAPVTDKARLHDKISRIKADGNTNISEGLRLGYQEVAQNYKKGAVNRVLLLSDGLATAGVQDPTQLTRFAEAAFREKGIATSTFGVGADYNEDLMTNIADHAGANYYFIGNPEAIAGIFSKELQGLMSVVAQGTMLKMKIPSQFTVEKVHGYQHVMFGDELMVNLNDLFANETKGILVQLNCKQEISEEIGIDCHLTYHDAKNQNFSETRKVKLSPTENEKEYQDAKNMKVEEQIVLFRSTELFDEALKAADKGEYEAATEKASAARVFLDQNKSKEFSPRFQKQLENVSKYDKDVSNMSAMPVEEQKMLQKEGKSLNYNTKKGK